MTISVLQWNIWGWEDIRNIVKFLKSHQADIICLQELTVDNPDQIIKNTPPYVAEQLGYNYFYKELPIESTDGQKIMLANGIYSRFPITKSRFVWINEPLDTTYGYGNEYRAYVEAMLNIKGQTIRVATVHMSYTHRFEITPNKKQETDRLVKELVKNKEKFIFTGDLNATPDSYTIKSISKILESAGPDFSKKSWATKPFSYKGFEESELNWRLDYVFATKDLKPVSAEVLQTEYSDHLPVFVSLEL